MSTKFRANFLSRHPLISVPLLVMGLIACLHYFWQWVVTASINPHPQDSVTVRGAFPFDKGFELAFIQSAHTTTPWVNVVCGGFGFIRDMSGTSCRGGKEVLLPRKLDCCHYEITFHRDHYLPSIAGWEHSGFGVRATKGADRLMRGSFSGLARGATEMRCLDDPEKLVRLDGLFCVGANSIGPNIYEKSTREVEISFRLESSLKLQQPK